jgi:hypothetical protein
MSLINTHLDEYRLQYELSNLDKFENRTSIFGAFEAYKADTQYTIPGAAELVRNYDGHREVSIPVIDRSTMTSTATRHCAPGTVVPTSTYVTPTWTTIEIDFNMVPAEHKGNYLSYQNVFTHQMDTMQRTFLAALDTAAYTSLEANHSAVNAADGNPYTVAFDSMVVPAADNDLFFNELNQVFLQNDLPIDNINVVSSPRAATALVAELNAQGPGNNANRAFQFGNKSFYASNRVTVAANDRDTLFASPQGSLAFLSYVDEQSRLGGDIGIWKWSTEMLPKLGFEVGLLYKAYCTDMSAAAYGSANHTSIYEMFQFSFDYSFVVAYTSAASAIGSPIFKANFTIA